MKKKECYYLNRERKCRSLDCIEKRDKELTAISRQILLTPGPFGYV